jgi:serine/threonine-protein kinase
MAVCPRCSAKVVPGDEVCKACGRTLPHALRADDDDGDAMIGRTIADKYEIVELIGEGAMGRVYEARQLALEKDIAIKVLHKHLANDPKVKKRFHREARAASRLSHPNSLHIIDFGEAKDGTLFIAMELLDGDDLLAVIEEDAPLTPRRIYEIMKQVLSALESAHHAGIIHRDLKPENVVVLESPSGEEHIKVCDFGIAKIQEAEGGSAITVTGFVCGTPEYMAPEQARGEELDKRADIYAAGCMLYQMLTASLPFMAESALGIITKHLTENPTPPSQRKPEWNIPLVLERVCMKAMTKDREARYPDAATMSAELKEAVRALGEDADKPLGAFEVEGDTLVGEGDTDADDERPRSFAWVVLVVLGAAAVVLALYSAGEEDDDRGGDNVVQVATPPPMDAGSETSEDARTRDTGALAAAGRDAGADADASAADAALLAVADTGATTSNRPGQGHRPRMRRGMRRSNEEASGSMDTPTENRGQVAYREGRERFLANDIDGAIERFLEAARLMPTNAQVQKQLGRAHMRAGHVDAGVRAYQRYLELAPNAGDRAIIERLIARAQ